MSAWVKEHSGKILAGVIVVALILLIVVPIVTSFGMADLCVRRPMCVSECCPDASGFKSSGADGVRNFTGGALSMVRKKLQM